MVLMTSLIDLIRDNLVSTILIVVGCILVFIFNWRLKMEIGLGMFCIVIFLLAIGTHLASKGKSR
jgi:hypothetical protein